MKNTTLNEAIYTVLTTKYKKEAREAFKRVQNAGYDVYKYQGQFRISNHSTGKTIYISEEHSRYGQLKDGSYGYITFREAYLGNGRCQPYNSNMDLVAALDKPQNKVWNEMKHNEYWKSRDSKGEAVKRYNSEIRRKRDYMKICDSSIEKYHKDIDRLLQAIARQEKRKAEYAADIVKAKAEMGLA